MNYQEYKTLLESVKRTLAALEPYTRKPYGFWFCRENTIYLVDYPCGDEPRMIYLPLVIQ